MPGKRFSVTHLEAAGAVKVARGDGSRNSLIAVVRQWGSAFWAFEGLAGSLCLHVHAEVNHFHNLDRVKGRKIRQIK